MGGGGGADYSPGKWTNHLHNLHIAGSSPVEDMHSGRDSVLDLGGGVGVGYAVVHSNCAVYCMDFSK